jgi:hypothetical protein
MGTGSPFPGGKARPGRDADHSPPSSAEIENEHELYVLSPQAPSWRIVEHLLAPSNDCVLSMVLSRVAADSYLIFNDPKILVKDQENTLYMSSPESHVSTSRMAQVTSGLSEPITFE